MLTLNHPLTTKRKINIEKIINIVPVDIMKIGIIAPLKKRVKNSIKNMEINFHF